MIPRCPLCEWELEEDVYYQLDDMDEIIPLAIVMDEKLASLIKPIPVYSDREIFPKSRMDGEIWEEEHCCPKCKKNFLVKYNDDLTI